jgi:hypothetical protein
MAKKSKPSVSHQGWGIATSKIQRRIRKETFSLKKNSFLMPH